MTAAVSSHSDLQHHINS